MKTTMTFMTKHNGVSISIKCVLITIAFSPVVTITLSFLRFPFSYKSVTMTFCLTTSVKKYLLQSLLIGYTEE